MRESFSSYYAINLVSLRRSDLPLPIALQPCIGQDLALLCDGMRFVFEGRVLAAAYRK